MDYFVSIAPTLSTIFFFLFFCYIIYFVLSKKNNKNFDKYSKIPLNEEEIAKRNKENISKKESNSEEK